MRRPRVIRGGAAKPRSGASYYHGGRLRRFCRWGGITILACAILILSGLSGFGKSVALANDSRDIGFYCIRQIFRADMLLKPFISYTVRKPKNRKYRERKPKIAPLVKHRNKPGRDRLRYRSSSTELAPQWHSVAKCCFLIDQWTEEKLLRPFAGKPAANTR